MSRSRKKKGRPKPAFVELICAKLLRSFSCFFSLRGCFGRAGFVITGGFSFFFFPRSAFAPFFGFRFLFLRLSNRRSLGKRSAALHANLQRCIYVVMESQFHFVIA